MHSISKRILLIPNGILKWIIVATVLAVAHWLIRVVLPSFSMVYDGPPQPQWIRWTVYAEFCGHLLSLGALFSVTGQAIPSLNKPGYSDEGTVSVMDPGTVEASTDWTALLTAWGFAPVYLLLWAGAYGYF